MPRNFLFLLGILLAIVQIHGHLVTTTNPFPLTPNLLGINYIYSDPNKSHYVCFDAPLARNYITSP